MGCLNTYTEYSMGFQPIRHMMSKGLLILIMAGAAALLGIFIACVISIVNTVRIKKLIDSLEVK